MQKMYEFRQTQMEKMESDPTLEEGDITSVNLTIVNGGVLYNVKYNMYHYCTLPHCGKLKKNW